MLLKFENHLIKSHQLLHFDELHQINEKFEQIPFDSDLFKEILKANRNYESGTVHIDKKGLIQLTFNYNDGFNTHYYLVRLQENN